MNSPGSAKLRLNFRNLPLVDAAVRASFESPVELTFRGLYALADALQPDFPSQTELDQFQMPPGVRSPSMVLGPGQIPGAVYTGHKEGLSITVQSQVIIARWVKKVVTSAPDYPRYKALADALWRATKGFSETYARQAPRIVVVNMSYVNFLQIAHDQPVLLRYFSEKARVEAAKGARKIHKVETSWQEPDGVDLRFSLEQVTATVDAAKVEGFRLTTAAGKRLVEGDGKEDALEMIHDRLQIFFFEILSEQAKTEWDLEPVDV